MRSGIRSYFSGQDPSFSEIFADVAKRQRQRKDVATEKLQGIMDAKQIYGPYAEQASKLLTDQIKAIGDSLDVDQQKVSAAAAEYAKVYGYSEQFKDFIEQSAAVYKADNEVNTPTALAAIRAQYVKEGTLDELEKNIMNGMDAEDVLLKTPGALNEDIVMKNRLDQIGKVVSEITTPGNLTPAQGAAARHYFGMDEETFKMEFSNVMEYDTSTGTVKIKDPQGLVDSGIADALLSDKRVQAIVDRRLSDRGVELTEDNRLAELPRVLAPYTSAKVTRDIKRTFVKNPAIEQALERERNNIARMAARGGDQPSGDALILATNAIVAAKTIEEKRGAWDLANIRFNEAQYVRNHEGKVINKETGQPLKPGERPEKYGERIVIPASGAKLLGQSSLIPQGIETPTYRFGRMLVDQEGNAWMEAYAKDVKRSIGVDGTEGDSYSETVTVSNRPEFLPFSPSLFDGALRDANSRSSYNQIITGYGMSTFSYPIRTKGGAAKPAQAQPEKKASNVSELFKAPEPVKVTGPTVPLMYKTPGSQ
jgi:hypothetical protein